MVKVKEKIIKNSKKRIEDTKKIIDETRKKINAIEYEPHLYRRVFHAFGASFLFYYVLPDLDWINFLKFWLPLVVLIILVILEILRLTGKVSSDHFFGLRMYEQKRVGSYLFFAVAIIFLLLFFPQQIAIPCILCACLGDPIIGELRHRLNKNYAYVIGLILCMFFFMVTWYSVDVWLMILVSFVGGIGAIIGEVKKFWWLDDDFMIQILPSILLLIIWFGMSYWDMSHPNIVIYPAVWPL